MIEVTRKLCPSPQAYGQTHHLVPRPAAPPRGAMQQVCAYCGKTEKEIREEHDNGDDR